MSLKNRYIVATRPSLLATTQTNQTLDLLRKKFPDITFDLVKFSTHGDMVIDKPLTEFGGTGVFVKELELAIERGEADFAVHSLKDVPGVLQEKFVIAAFPKREDPRDVILTRNNVPLADLPDDCIVGTSSPRRTLQVSKLKPKAVFKDLRGNIDTRLRKLEEGQYDAIVMAAAGLKRLGKDVPENAFMPLDTCLPAIGQGIIGLECKKDDLETIELLRSINHPLTETAALAERKFMSVIGGGCKFPLGAHAVIRGNELTLYAMIGNNLTGDLIRRQMISTTDKAEECGEELAGIILKESDRLGINLNF